MPCVYIPLGNGSYAIAKVQNPRAKTCSVCGARSRDVKLCDYEVRPATASEPLDGLSVPIAAKTCDVVLCLGCAVHQAPDTDYCPTHAAALGINGRKLRL